MTKEMSEDFFEWLDKCPVQWFLLTTNEGSRDYTFIIPSDGEED